jgi:hypothetical protein
VSGELVAILPNRAPDAFETYKSVSHCNLLRGNLDQLL